MNRSFDWDKQISEEFKRAQELQLSWRTPSMFSACGKYVLFASVDLDCSVEDTQLLIGMLAIIRDRLFSEKDMRSYVAARDDAIACCQLIYESTGDDEYAWLQGEIELNREWEMPAMPE